MKPILCFIICTFLFQQQTYSQEINNNTNTPLKRAWTISTNPYQVVKRIYNVTLSYDYDIFVIGVNYGFAWNQIGFHFPKKIDSFHTISLDTDVPVPSNVKNNFYLKARMTSEWLINLSQQASFVWSLSLGPISKIQFVDNRYQLEYGVLWTQIFLNQGMSSGLYPHINIGFLF